MELERRSHKLHTLCMVSVSVYGENRTPRTRENARLALSERICPDRLHVSKARPDFEETGDFEGTSERISKPTSSGSGGWRNRHNSSESALGLTELEQKLAGERFQRDVEAVFGLLRRAGFVWVLRKIELIRWSLTICFTHVGNIK